MRKCLLLAIALIAVVGCGGGDPPAPAAGSKSINWADYQKMSEQDQADPYVLANIDDDARAKLAEKSKKQKR